MTSRRCGRRRGGELRGGASRSITGIRHVSAQAAQGPSSRSDPLEQRAIYVR
jgi:hypothetical protein